MSIWTLNVASYSSIGEEKKKEVWFGQEKGKMGSKEKGKKTQVGRSHDSMTNAVNHYLVQSFQDR